MTGTVEDEVAALARVYPGARLLDLPGRHVVLIPELRLADEQWSPLVVRGLLICDLWPNQRPQLLVEASVKRHGQAPANFSRQLLADEAWFGYSFQAPYNASHPALVPVVRGWLRRFDGRAS
ncbi:MAG: hypothetical protein ACYCXA_06730 [Actinomycetes bacterium]